MGVFVDKLQFKLDGSSWLVRVAGRFSGLSYKVKIDDQLLIDEKPNQALDEILSSQSFQIRHKGKDYRLEIGPISATKTGVHIYNGSELIYRHDERDFASFSRLKKYMARIDKYANETHARDPRPLWKQYLDVLIIGSGLGVTFFAIRLAMGELGGLDIGHIEFWPTGAIITALVFWFWPEKFRIIR